MSAVIQVENLSKSYIVPVRQGGFLSALRSLAVRENREVKAVDRVSFAMEAGEVVGFLGPNGAGKTTTLKMLSGLLHPSGGNVQVLGHVPWQRDRDYLRQITLVMGNRHQLEWDIPCIDTFELNRAVYRIPHARYRSTLDELVALLDLEALLSKPVRNLSLGERMKCEIAAALLHGPQVLFLDEPTLGLDVTMQRRIRAFVRDYNQRYGSTVLLTSHYMADVEALCKRIVVIHHGQLLYDGDISGLVERFSPHKTIAVQLSNGYDPRIRTYGEVVEEDGALVKLRVPKAETPLVTSRLLTDLQIADLSVEDPSIEEVIEQVFAAEMEPLFRPTGSENHADPETKAGQTSPEGPEGE